MLIKPTKLEHARVELLKSISLKKNAIEVPLENASERISNKKIDSKLNLPSTANSAVDGYGISSATFFDNPNTVFKVIGVAKLGALGTLIVGCTKHSLRGTIIVGRASVPTVVCRHSRSAGRAG